ncbi:DNA-protecting protein DprA [Candidatus Peregrinibacteria bacterium]|nr:DNA-protecting protein DprA [Candidatus Peregrinibacteria bacterium]
MTITIQKLTNNQFPSALLEIPEPPKTLHLAGILPPEDTILLTVVGSRKYTSYGKMACEKIIQGLSGYPIAIVSGLALGIDTIAHRAAIEAGLKTIAVPGSGLGEQALYPASNKTLAKEIVADGGALLSEFPPDFRATQWSFPQRNRIMAGLSRGVLIIEASEQSGTLITARLALDYNRDVYVVPGSIFSDGTRGSNALIKGGATPITSSADMLVALGFETTQYNSTAKENANPEEALVLELLREPLPRDTIIQALNRPTHEINMLLSVMELKGLIKERLGSIYKT